MNKTSFALKVAIPLALFSIQTQTSYAADGVKLTDSGLELTVTANRRPEIASNSLAPNTVITQEDIERIQATTVAEVLTRVPGINVTNSGGVGKATSIFIRGTNSNQVLVLIDGVRHGSATLGSTAFQHLSVEQIERIEVVRGPRSSLYGSDSIGGVIQIFTKKGAKGFSPTLKLSAGTNDTFEGSVNFAGGNDKTTYNLNLQRETTGGIDACNSTTSGCFADEPDRDGYDRQAVSLNLNHTFSDKLKGAFSFLRTEGDNDFDGGFQNQSEFVQQVLNAKLIGDVSDSLNLSFTVGQSRDESDNFLNGVFTGNFDTKRDTASFIADYSINANNKLLFGADWYDDQISSNTDFAVTSRYNTGVFGSYSAQLNNTQLDASIRFDDNEQFGSETTGGIAIGQRISSGLRVKASYGTAFNAPTFNQLYFPGFGNEDLEPEESENFELGFDGQLGKGKWEFNLFQNDIENLIAGFPVANINEARIQGLEASFTVDLAGYNLSTNFTAQKPESRTGDNAGNILANRPRRILNIDIDRKFGAFSLGSTIHAESERFSNAANTARLGGFATLDLRADYAVSKSWSLGLKIGNVLDKDYATNAGFNQDGVNGLISLKYAPK